MAYYTLHGRRPGRVPCYGRRRACLRTPRAHRERWIHVKMMFGPSSITLSFVDDVLSSSAEGVDRETEDEDSFVGAFLIENAY
jgi:hypothetical protein